MNNRIHTSKLVKLYYLLLQTFNFIKLQFSFNYMASETC